MGHSTLKPSAAALFAVIAALLAAMGMEHFIRACEDGVFYGVFKWAWSAIVGFSFMSY